MVQDLTANYDFTTGNTMWSSIGRAVDRLHRDLEYSSPEHEVVFTGDCVERDSKRFYVDYLTDKTFCDCCGRRLDKIPWHFEDNYDKLCKSCSKFMSIKMKDTLFEDAQVVIGEFDNGNFKLSKPWTILDREESNAIDNVLLWD